MARDLDLDFEEMDEPKAPVRPKKPAAASSSVKKAAPKAAGPRGGAGAGMKSPAAPKRKNSNMSSIIILIVEVIVLIALIVAFFVIKGKIDKADKPSKNGTATEGSQEAGGSSGGVNVESDSFTLTCTKVQLANDVDNSPVALIYFTFVNKTDTPLSMNEVFPPSLTQTGMPCDSDSVVLVEYPTEFENKNTEVSNGESIDCCYAFKIYDMTSPLTLTTHDNYSTFTDIGSTEIPIS